MKKEDLSQKKLVLRKVVISEGEYILSEPTAGELLEILIEKFKVEIAADVQVALIGDEDWLGRLAEAIRQG